MLRVNAHQPSPFTIVPESGNGQSSQPRTPTNKTRYFARAARRPAHASVRIERFADPEIAKFCDAWNSLL
jgi:hypothetical protein